MFQSIQGLKYFLCLTDVDMILYNKNYVVLKNTVPQEH